MITDTHGARGKYPELDGIRGIAILMVLVYHCAGFAPSTMPDKIVNQVSEFGWAGVDLFFALSGFLITGILFDSKTKEGYLKTFFGRRVLRIFPLYAAFLLGITIFAYWLAPSLPASRQFLHLEPWYWLYGVNFLVAKRGDFTSMPFGTGILWSLAIEEQFYLIWPIVVWKLGRTALMKVCVALIICAIVLRVLLHRHGVNAAAIYAITPTRMDALLVGAFAALLLRGATAPKDLRAYGRIAALIGGGLVAAAVLLDFKTDPEGAYMQMVGYSGIGLLAASVILATRLMAPHALLRRALRSRPLLFFGAYSYAIYVLHFIVRDWVFRLFPPLESLPTHAGMQFPWVLLRAVCAVGLAVLAALLSWHLIEKRFLAMKGYFRYGPDVRAAAGAPKAVPAKS